MPLRRCLCGRFLGAMGRAVPPTRPIWGISIGRPLDACSACWPWQAHCGSWALSTGAARAVIARFRSPRPLALALVLTTAGLSCVATNDMALIMMLPLSAATLMGAKPPPSRGARVRSAKSGCEPLRDDRPLRQPAEPVSLFLLRARPRRFPGRYGTALRAVDRRASSPAPGGCAVSRTAAVAETIRAVSPCRCRSADGAWQSTERLSPSTLPGRIPHRARRRRRRRRSRRARRPPTGAPWAP